MDGIHIVAFAEEEDPGLYHLLRSVFVGFAVHLRPRR